jgi:hypothetical protein
MQTLNTFFHWQYLGILAIIWLVVDLAWTIRWRALLERISKLFSAPWIFAKDTEPQRHPLYPRLFLEQLAQNNIAVGRADSGSSDNLSKWWKALGDRVFRDVSPLISIGHVISLIFFLFFLFADAVTVANTLVLIGVESPNLPPILQRLDLAILGGALVSATVGIWIFIEMFGKGEFIATEQMSVAQKRVFKFLSILVTLFSVVVMLALAGQRLISLGTYASTPAFDFAISFALYGLLALNSSLAAALTFQSAALGIVVLILLLAVVLAIVMPVLVFLFDLLWRGVIVVLDVISWAIFTPAIAIPYGFGRIFGSKKSVKEGESTKDLQGKE